jgi:hypothetical protein
LPFDVVKEPERTGPETGIGLKQKLKPEKRTEFFFLACDPEYGDVKGSVKKTLSILAPT